MIQCLSAWTGFGSSKHSIYQEPQSIMIHLSRASLMTNMIRDIISTGYKLTNMGGQIGEWHPH
jgi:hypothetical protein